MGLKTEAMSVTLFEHAGALEEPNRYKHVFKRCPHPSLHAPERKPDQVVAKKPAAVAKHSLD